MHPEMPGVNELHDKTSVDLKSKIKKKYIPCLHSYLGSL